MNCVPVFNEPTKKLLCAWLKCIHATWGSDVMSSSYYFFCLDLKDSLQMTEIQQYKTGKQILDILA